MQQLSAKEFEEKLCSICDFLVENPKLQTACRSVGYSAKYVWTFLRRSSEGDAKYLIRWPDRDSERRVQFADAVTQARKAWQPRVRMFDGAVVVWEQDAEALAEWGGDNLQSKEAAERLGGVYDYPYKHRVGKNGKLERITVRSPNPPENRQVQASLPPYHKNYQPPAEAATPLQRDLRARLAELRSKGPQNPIPKDQNGRFTIVSVQTAPIRPDERADHTGRGALPRLDADGNVVGRGNAPPMISRRGIPAPGGFSTLTGLPT